VRDREGQVDRCEDMERDRPHEEIRRTCSPHFWECVVLFNSRSKII
jgi:hypothetical protein